ncbi:MAG: FAD/NAD(P)-binding oxidoreductase [Gallionella sp.]|jgi:sulfide:quinone oxidoreductase|nr:FAD/NAD(P)-binding oxidoreductase [Gallionella sp.]
MAHIVIMGAGLGGLPAAYEMRDRLGPSHAVSVISNDEYFHFVPSNPWVAVKWRERKQIEFPIRSYLERRDIQFFSTGVRRVHPGENRLELNDGQSVSYDYLVIATGPKLAFEEVEGLGPGGHTHSICHVDHAMKSHEEWESFCKNPGPIVVGAVQGASCFGPAYEYAFIMETDLRKRRIRDKVPMTFVTSEPYIGHLGLGGVGDSKGILESGMRDKHIKWICNAKVTRIEDGKMYVTEHDDMGAEKKQHELAFSYSMMLPAFKGVDAVAGIEGLTNPRGFVIVDKHQRNPTFKNVFAVGVCVAIPPVEPTPIPVGTPKTGYMIESMVAATVYNIHADLNGTQADREATWNAVCLADFGETGVAFVAMPQIPPRNVNWFSEGKWVHLAKVAFERYFIRKMKKGTSEPFYESSVLRMLGIEKLK